MPQLEELGWSDFFAKQIGKSEEVLAPARVLEESRELYRVLGAAGEWPADLAGRLRYAARAPGALPVVGDWVLLNMQGERGVIHRVLERKSKFSRQAAGRRSDEQIVAANLDTVFLVSGLDRDFNPRRIERYVTLVWEGGARPVVLLNKADLCQELEERLLAAQDAAPGVTVRAVSAASGAGLDHLAPYLTPGQTVALLGSSGVGKSTLINRLLGGELLRTQPVRAGDSRGRHTTSARRMIPLPSGALLVDTPGLRELQLGQADAGIGAAFADIEGLAAECRFADCRHSGEPGCGVAHAVEQGRLDEHRLHNYHKLQKELAFELSKHDKAARAAAEKRWRSIHRQLKQLDRLRQRT